MLQALGHLEQPQQAITSGLPPLAHFTFDFTADYLPEPTCERLEVLWFQSGEHIKLSISSEPMQLSTETDCSDSQYFARITGHRGLPVIEVTAPWPLSTVKIPKPWGAEIWYTGIEARGVCMVAGIPLPWLTHLLPPALIGQAAGGAPLLLKILAPLSDPHLGNLYFELHEKKIEVYVVTDVDKHAWPGGIGKIRYGFRQEKRAMFKQDSDFRAAYIDSVSNYKRVRQQIDALLEPMRSGAGYPADSEIPPVVMQDWLTSIPADLAAQETALRAEMESFTYFRDIEVGDVITVEPYFPHSLQHGIRVVEFQTASYERHILSFGQKVLTQSHWDTETGMANAILDLPESRPLTRLPSIQGVVIEVIADFDAFSALRITVPADVTYEHDPFADYQLVIGVAGSAVVDGYRLEPELACLLPPKPEAPINIHSSGGAVLLIAAPKPNA